MQTGRAIHGTTRLAIDVVEGINGIVEDMYRNIAAAPLPFGEEPKGPAPGIAGFVHDAIRHVNAGVRGLSDLALAPLSAPIDRLCPPGPQREAVVALLNGVCGDHLERTGNPLAIPLELRLLDSGERPPTGRVLLLVHGLCMNDRHWTWRRHSHAHALADAFGYTPVYLRYNSGRHISVNGRQLAERLDDFIAGWPVPFESLTLVGMSMGGLVIRSALHVAREDGFEWPGRVDKAVYIGTPHHGAALERGGFWLQKATTASPYTAPLSALGRIRSEGITDLRHGNVLDEDWKHCDPHADPRDCRTPSPLAEGVEHHAIAASLSKRPGERIGRLLGDGLVHPSSATGRHADPRRHLDFDPKRTRILYGQSHLGLLDDPRVTACLSDWLG